jgi:hypothetical protein
MLKSGTDTKEKERSAALDRLNPAWLAVGSTGRDPSV